MKPQPNLPLVHGGSDPCGTAITIDGTSFNDPAITNNGNCTTGITISIFVSTDLDLPAEYTVERQYYCGTNSSGTPNSTWTQITYDGGSETDLHELDVLNYGSRTDQGYGQLGGGSNYWYIVRYRVVGADGTTVCDTGANSSYLNLGTLYSCLD